MKVRNRIAALSVVRKASLLKGSEEFSHVFIAPDRSPEERVRQRELVKEVARRSDDFHRRHCISNGYWRGG